MNSKLQVAAVSLALTLGATSSARAALVNLFVPDNATFIQGNLQWAWASPVAGDGSFVSGLGAIDLSFQGPLGWRIPTATDLLSLPSAGDFVFAGANVPLGMVDAASGANFQFGSPGGDAACAAPYFNADFRHCDWGNAPGSGGASIHSWWPDGGFVSFSESLVVRDAVPEPTTLALLGLGLAGIRFGRRKSLS